MDLRLAGEGVAISECRLAIGEWRFEIGGMDLRLAGTSLRQGFRLRRVGYGGQDGGQALALQA